MNAIAMMFLILFFMFVGQAFGAILQMKNYQKSAKRLHKSGNVGIGQKKGGFSFGYLVLVCCDSDGIIKAVETMEGMTLLAKFRPKKAILGREFEGAHIEEFLSDFRALDKRGRKRYKGYIQAFEALDMRLYPEHYSQEVLENRSAIPQIH